VVAAEQGQVSVAVLPRHLDVDMLRPLLTFAMMAAAQAQVTPSADSNLLSRVQRGDRDAILEVGKTGDKSFIPVLESMARPQYVDQIDTNTFRNMNPQQVKTLRNSLWHPVYDDPAAVNARMALAKLGVKDYLDEILLELTDPPSSPLYKEREVHPAYRYNPIRLRGEAFRKLAYIKNPSTVRTIASFLPIISEPVTGTDVMYDSYSEQAMQALAQIVDNPPQVNLPVDSETLEARSKIWQRWWEQNKDKYP
jgi:hypothetical protein